MEREISKMREEAARLHEAGDKLWNTNSRRESPGGKPAEKNSTHVQTGDRIEEGTPVEPVDTVRGSPDRRHSGAPKLEGHDAARDDANTVAYLLKAAEHGDVQAQCILGTLYARGQGVPKNEAKAVQLYEEAAAKKHADAQYALAWMYAYGRGVPRDEVKAVQWCLKAAEQGIGTRHACQNLRHTAK